MPKKFLILFSFFILIAGGIIAQTCPPGNPYSPSLQDCGDIAPNFNTTGSSFCVGDSVGVTLSTAIPVDSIIFCWGDGSIDTIFGIVTTMPTSFYHFYNFPADSCPCPSNSTSPNIQIFFIKHCGALYSSKLISFYTTIRFKPKSRFAIYDTLCLGDPLIINIPPCPNACANGSISNPSYIHWTVSPSYTLDTTSQTNDIITPPPFYFMNSGSYTVTLRDSNICGVTSYSRPVRVVENAAIHPFLILNDTCAPAQFQPVLNSNGVDSAHWSVIPLSGGTYSINPLLDSVCTITLNDEGDYQISVQAYDYCCAFSTLSICTWDTIIHISAGPVLSYNSVPDSCTGFANFDFNNFSIVNTATTNYHWTLTDSASGSILINDSTGNPPSVNLVPGTYYVNINSSNNCDNEVVLDTFRVFSLPTLVLSNDTSLCKGELFYFSAMPSGGVWTLNGNVVVSPVSTSNLAAVNNFIYTISNPCVVSDQVILNVLGTNVSAAGNDTVFCANDAPYNFTATTASGYWTSTSGVILPNGYYDPTLSTVAYDTIVYVDSLSASCIVRDTIHVVVFTLPASSPFGIADTACVGAVVNFNNPIPGSNATWLFGDAPPNPVSGNSVTHSYLSTGLFSIDITISDNNSGCSIQAADSILIIDAPTANFTVNQTTLCGNDSVMITSLSPQQNGHIYTWNYGYGSDQILYNPIYISFPLTLNDTTYHVLFKDSNACGVDTFGLDIHIIALPNSDFSFYPLVPCSGDTIGFGNASTGGGNIYSWYMNGTLFSSANIPNDTILTAPVNDVDYYLTLISQNQCASDTLMDTLTVHPATVTPFFTESPNPACANDTISFNSTVASYQYIYWKFGDGNSASGYDVTHLYGVAGTYNAWQIVVGYCGIDSLFHTITVRDTPVAAFTYSNILCYNNPVSFTNNTSGVNTYQWNFGDLTFSPNTNSTHQFDTAGVYDVTLTAIDANGCRDSITQPVLIHAIPLAAFSVPINNVCLGDSVQLISSTTGVVSYNWNLDTVTQTGNPIWYTWPQSGTYTITLTVTDNNQCSDDTTFNSVFIWPMAVSNFSVTQADICQLPSNLLFNSAGSVASSYNWDFASHGTSSAANPVLNITNGDVFLAQLTTHTDTFDCPDISQQLITVYEPPVASFTFSDSLCRGEDVLMTNTSQFATSYNWNFGNNQTAQTVDGFMTYDLAGSYGIMLIATNDTSCSDSAFANLVIHENPVAYFTISDYDTTIAGTDYTPCGYYQLRDSSSFDVVSWNWDFGNGQISSDKNPLVYFPLNSDFLITLQVENAYGCQNYFSKIHEVECPGQLLIPNSLIPALQPEDNGYFIPVGDRLKEFEIKIFSRYGELVWSSDKLDEEGKPSEKWNGTMQENPVPAGTYTWTVTKAIFMNDKDWDGMKFPGSDSKLKHGTVELIR